MLSSLLVKAAVHSRTAVHSQHHAHDHVPARILASVIEVFHASSAMMPRSNAARPPNMMTTMDFPRSPDTLKHLAYLDTEVPTPVLLVAFF
jgi:hypothetical protein